MLIINFQSYLVTFYKTLKLAVKTKIGLAIAT